MTNQQARDRLFEYAYGEMSPQDAVAFEAALREDPDLRADLDAVSVVRRAAAGLKDHELPLAAHRNILAAARRATRQRAMARPWEALQRFLLSPSFLGATAIIAAVVVGAHLIPLQEIDDPWTRADREQRAAALAPAESALMAAASVEPVPVAAAPSQRAQEAGEALVQDARGRAGGTTATATATAASTPDRVHVESRQARKELVGQASGQVAAKPRAAKGPASIAPAAASLRMLSDESIGFEAAGSGFVQEDAKRSKAEVRRFAAPAASPPMPEPMPEAELANEPPAPPAMAKVARNVRADAAGLLKEARDERAAGRLPDALALCRAALAAGPSDNLLADILAEAAQLALAISRHDEAEGYLTRLERLPGGADRAGKIRLK